MDWLTDAKEILTRLEEVYPAGPHALMLDSESGNLVLVATAGNSQWMFELGDWLEETETIELVIGNILDRIREDIESVKPLFLSQPISRN